MKQIEAAGRLLASDAVHLENAGADFIVLCTNTMHAVAPAIEEAISVPFLHVGDATAVSAAGVENVALLGTRYTMEQDFYRSRLESHGIGVVVPDEPDHSLVHDVIYDELVRGVITADSRARIVSVVDRLVERGAGGVIGP